MGAVQLEKLDGFVQSRRSSATEFRDALSRFEDVFEFQQETPKGAHSWFGFPMTIQPNAGFSRSDIMTYLGQQNVETRPIICGNIARQPAMKSQVRRTVGDLQNADVVMENGFSFGNHQHIDAAARQYVVDKIAQFMGTQA